MAETEINFLKKTYFRRESRLLRHYESNLDRNTVLACLSQHDYDHYTRAGFKRCHFIPTFLPWQVQTAATGKGSYCLYHGNMAVSENRAAAAWLVRDVFAGLDVPFIIAGNGLTEKFIRNLPPNVTLVASPSVPQLEELIEKAQVNVLPSLNKTGVKLKLLHALYKGRFCVSNPEGILGSGISKGILLAREPSEFRALILRCMNTEFMEKDRLERKELNTIYDNAANASKLSALLW